MTTEPRRGNGVNVANEQTEQALACHRRGWTVIDLPWGEKSPNRKGWQHERNETEQSVLDRFSGQPRNVGVILGAASRNLIDLDQDSAELARVVRTYVPKTEASFGRRSKPNGHLLYTSDPLPESKKFADPIPKAEGGMGTIGEIRAKDTLLTLLPGSFHRASGESVEWFEAGEPAEVDGSELFTAYAQACAEVLLRHHWPGEGARHEPALALAGGLLRAGWEEDEVKRLLNYLWDSAEPGQIDGVVRTTAAKLDGGDGKVTGWRTLEEHVNPAVVRTVKKWLGISDTHDRPPLTDFGNAERFHARYGRDVRYVKPWDSWMLWDGRRWARDDTGEVYERGKETIRAISKEAADEPDGERRKAILKWAMASEQGRKLDVMLQRAQSMEGIAARPDDFDQNPALLNLANGTLDLDRMELREARREDLITKVAPVAYLPSLTCPTWEAFIESAMRVTSGDRLVDQPKMVAYLRRLVGYMLSGDTSEKMLPIAYGPGDTGKTTFSEILLALVGEDYGKTTAEETIASKHGKYSSIPNDVAALRGARLVVVSETSEDLQLNEGRIKAMTGRNQIQARFMFQEFFEFVPEFKILIETNHRPQVKGTDSAIWNRIKPIPFLNVVPKERQNPTLPDRLRAELPGILNWALAGYVDWRTNGMQEPDVVRTANEEYKAQSDRLGEFLAETCIVGDGRVRSGDLYHRYKWFMEDRGMHPLGDQKFSAAMRERGFEKKTVKGYGTWLGLRLKPTPGPSLDR